MLLSSPLEAARQLGETLEPERVYERFHLLLADVVPHDGVVVSSYDEAEGLIRCDYAWVEGQSLFGSGQLAAGTAQSRGRGDAEPGDCHRRAATRKRCGAAHGGVQRYVLQRRP